MARDGSGNFTRPVANYIAGNTIVSDDMDTEMDGMATALTNSIASNGETPTTASIPFANGLSTNTIAENTASSGVTADGVLLKDSAVTASSGANVDTISEITSGVGVTVDSTLLKDGGVQLGTAGTVVFEGATANDFETTVTVVDPTADNTITLPDATGTMMVDPITMRGDLIRGNSSSASERLEIGAANTVLTSDGTDAAWGSVTGPAIVIGSDAEGDIIYRNASNYARLGIGTAGQALLVNSGATAPEWGSASATLGTEQATTSGTEFDFTSIPAGTKKIVVTFEGVSLSGTDNILVQLGDAVGFETTGYVGSSGRITDPNAASVQSSTSGFIVFVNNAAHVFSGTVSMFLSDSANFTWVASIQGKRATDSVIVGGGDKSLDAELTQVKITRSGSDTFDAGAVNIQYE